VSRPTRLWVVLALNLGLVGVLVTVSLSAHSLAVLAEGADYLADAAAIGVSLVAISLSNRSPTPSRPSGYPKATAIAALVNGGWLLIVSLLVIVGGVDRLAIGTREVQGMAVLIASGIAAVVMLCGALVLGGDVEDLDRDDDNGDLTVRAVLLDTSADAAAAAGVAATGAIITATGGLYWLDPTVAVIISGVVAYHAFRLVRRVAETLRETGSSR
jgi:cobalt-zinc-cadmium efflux system protein